MGSGFMRLARATGPAKDKRLALDFILASDAEFLVGLKRRRGRPPTWLSAEWSATRIRALGLWPGFTQASRAGRRVRPLGYPRHAARRPFGLAGALRRFGPCSPWERLALYGRERKRTAV